MPAPELSYWLMLGGVAVLTSIVSGVMGMAGGMLLLAVMLLRLEPNVAIPVHGIVQLVSNASRAWFLRSHVRWSAVWRFAWPLLPGGALGIWLLAYFSTLVGATGPLLGPFVLALELGSQGTIATLAACQIFQHGSKVLLFGLRGFHLAGYLVPSLFLCIGAIAGSAIGTRLLDRIPEKQFKVLIRIVLSVLAIEQLYEGVAGFVR